MHEPQYAVAWAQVLSMPATGHQSRHPNSKTQKIAAAEAAEHHDARVLTSALHRRWSRSSRT